MNKKTSNRCGFLVHDLFAKTARLNSLVVFVIEKNPDCEWGNSLMRLQSARCTIQCLSKYANMDTLIISLVPSILPTHEAGRIEGNLASYEDITKSMLSMQKDRKGGSVNENHRKRSKSLLSL